MGEAEEALVTEGQSFTCRTHPVKGNCPEPPSPPGHAGDLCWVVILPFSPIPLSLQWTSHHFVDSVSLLRDVSLLLFSFTSYLVSPWHTHTHVHTQRVVISIGNEEERIGIEPHADWLAWGWKANYSLFLTTTSDVMLFAVKALTGCTLNILAICPIRFCSPWLKPFKDSAACHFRADWLPNAHIWNTWFQY